jgi:hypothetical protein
VRTIIIGVVIAAIGGLGLLFGGIPYTERTELIHMGPIEATATTEERLAIPPLASGAILVLGLGIVVYGATVIRSS